MTNTTTTIAAVATFAFSHGGEVKAIIYTNGKVTTHVCGCPSLRACPGKCLPAYERL